MCQSYENIENMPEAQSIRRQKFMNGTLGSRNDQYFI